MGAGIRLGAVASGGPDKDCLMVLGTFCFLCCKGIKYSTFAKILQYFLVNTNIYFMGLLLLYLLELCV